MANYCIICFKGGERNNTSLNNVELQRKYFKFLERYLSEVGGGGDDGNGYQLSNFLFEQALNSGMVCCGRCHERMGAFCDLYDQLKIIELRLNWELERLKSNLEFGREVESVEGLNTDINYWSNETEMLELIRDLRTSIIDKCNRKLDRSLPNVTISKYIFEHGTCDSTSIVVVQRGPNLNEEDSSNQINYEDSIVKVDVDVNPAVGHETLHDLNSPGENLSTIMSDNGAIETSIEKRVKLPIEEIPCRRLREVNKCDKCLRTFSSPEKFLDHQKEYHYETAQEIREESGDEYESLKGSCSTDSDSEYSDFLANSEPEADENDELEDAFETEGEAEGDDEDKEDIKPIVKKEESYSKTKLLRRKHLSFKCHDCPNLYKHLHELLLHHNNVHKSSHASETLLADIVWIPYEMLPQNNWNRLVVINSDDFPPGALHHSATIETPTQVYFCKYSSCKEQPIYSEKALKEHAKLRRQFKCKFCSVKKKFAPDLSLHEVKQHNKKQMKEIHCPRCPFTNRVRKAVVNHHLTAHLNLPPFYTQGNCPICKVNNNSFRTSHALIGHCINHHNINLKEAAEVKRFKLKCPDCPKLYKYLRELLFHHKEDHSNPGEGTEPISVDIFNTSQEILSNLEKPEIEAAHKIEIPRIIFICPEQSCQKAFYSEDGLEQHKKLHGKFKCNFCKKLITSAVKLAQHEAKLHGKIGNGRLKVGTKRAKKSYQCPRCKETFCGEKPYIEHHVGTHLSLIIADHDCPICKISNFRKGYFLTRNKQYEMNHLRNYHDIKGLTPDAIRRCHVAGCGAYFRKVSQLNAHLQQHSLDKKEMKQAKKGIYKCAICGKGFGSTHYLQQHLRCLHKLDPNIFRCSKEKDCHSIFGTQQELDNHIRRKHSEGMKYFVKVNCPTCHQLVNKRSLSAHLRKHEREDAKQTKSFVCEKCGKCFKSSHNLQMHKLYHTGPESWPFTCEICGKKSAHKGRHNEHLRLHSKQKQFVCQVCGVAYAHRHNLRIHVNNKHSDVMKDIPRKIDTTYFKRKSKDTVSNVNKRRKIID